MAILKYPFRDNIDQISSMLRGHFNVPQRLALLKEFFHSLIILLIFFCTLIIFQKFVNKMKIIQQFVNLNKPAMIIKEGFLHEF